MDRESVLVWLCGKDGRLYGTERTPPNIVDALVAEGHVEWLTSVSGRGYVRITFAGRRWLEQRRGVADRCTYPTGCSRKRLPGLMMCRNHQPYPAR